MLRVVYLDHVASLSGGEIALVRLLRHLDEVEAHVILADAGPLVEELERCGARVEVLRMGHQGREARRTDLVSITTTPKVLVDSFIYTVRIARRLRKLRPDVVHTNSLKAGFYGSAAARAARVPCVWHVRDQVSEPYLPRRIARCVRLAIRLLPDEVIANSYSTRATLRGAKAAHVIYSPAPQAPVATATRVHSDFTVGVVGRLAPWKGQDVVLRAFAAARLPNSSRCVVVGSALFGEDDYARSLERLAHDLGIANRVVFRGFQEDVFAELAQMDVLIHASLTPEPFGQVIIEAMTAGVPVVAANAGGPAEILEHEKSGLLYMPGDVDGLRRAIERLAEDPNLRARLVAGAASRVSRFDGKAAARQVLDLYQSMTIRAR